MEIVLWSCAYLLVQDLDICSLTEMIKEHICLSVHDVEFQHSLILQMGSDSKHTGHITAKKNEIKCFGVERS